MSTERSTDQQHLQTCGELSRQFEEKCQTAYFLQPDVIPHGDVRVADRSLGHMRGQAEKVYLHACPAFMIRPAEDWWCWAVTAMTFTTHHYGLALVTLHEVKELWGCTGTATLAAILRLSTEEPNTPHWHTTRAHLCGIPPERVDWDYHTRAGYQVRCEPEVRHA